MRNRAQVGNINPPAAVPAHRLRRNFTVVMLYTPPIARITQRIKLTTGCNSPMIFLFALPFPVLVALYLGWRAGRRDPQGFREFWTHAAAALAWGFAVVFFGLLCGFELLGLEFFYDALTTAFIIIF